MRGSTWLLVLGLLSMACGVPAGSFEPSGLAPPGGGLTLVTEPTATRGLTWSNLRADGEQLTVDLVATESDVYKRQLMHMLYGACVGLAPMLRRNFARGNELQRGAAEMRKVGPVASR